MPINKLVQSPVTEPDLSATYAEMAADEEREAEASEWTDALLSDWTGETS